MTKINTDEGKRVSDLEAIETLPNSALILVSLTDGICKNITMKTLRKHLINPESTIPDLDNEVYSKSQVDTIVEDIANKSLGLTNKINKLDEKIQDINTKHDIDINDINTDISTRIQNVNTNINNINTSIDSTNKRIDATNVKVNDVDKKIDTEIQRIDNSINTTNKKIESEIQRVNTSINNTNDKIDTEIQRLEESITSSEEKSNTALTNYDRTIKQYISDSHTTLQDSIYTEVNNRIAANETKVKQWALDTINSSITKQETRTNYRLDAVTFDSGWIYLKDNRDLYAQIFEDYSDYQRVKFRKVGKTVEIKGVCKLIEELTMPYDIDTFVTIFQLPEGYSPSETVHRVCRGSSDDIFMLDITTNGNVNFTRYSKKGTYTDIVLPVNTRFILDCCYTVDTPYEYYWKYFGTRRDYVTFEEVSTQIGGSI